MFVVCLWYVVLTSHKLQALAHSTVVPHKEFIEPKMVRFSLGEKQDNMPLFQLIYVQLGQLRLESAKIGVDMIKPKITDKYHATVSAFSEVNRHKSQKSLSRTKRRTAIIC